MSMPNGEFRFKPKYITLCYFSLGCTVLISIVLKRQAVLVLLSDWMKSDYVNRLIEKFICSIKLMEMQKQSVYACPLIV